MSIIVEAFSRSGNTVASFAYNYKLKIAFLFLAQLVVFSLNPLTGTILGIFYFFRSKNLLFLIFTPCLLGLILASQVSTGSDTTDIFRYQQIFEKLSFDYVLWKLSIQSFLIKSKLFLFLSLLFKSTFGVSGTIYLWMTLPYLVMTSMVLWESKERNLSLLTLVIVTLFGVMNFPQMGEWIKQNNAMTFLILSLYLIQRRLKIGIPLILVAIFFHSSNLLLVPIICLSFLRNLKIYFVALVFGIIFSLWDLNEVITSNFCFSKELLPKFSCDFFALYIDFQNWKVTLKEHLSYFSLLLMLFFPSIFDIYKGRANLLQRFGFLYIIFLVSNISNAHNFIRYLWGAFPIGVIGLIYYFNNSATKYKKIFFFIISIFFLSHNTASLYMRTHRPTYRSEYVGGRLINLFTYNIFDYWKLIEGPKKK